MSDWIQPFLSVLALLGVGGIFGGYVTFILDKKKERDFRTFEKKETRYRSCLLYMDAYFVPRNIKYLSSRQPDISRAEDVFEYLQMEYHEMMLYASTAVILSLKAFLQEPSRGNFLQTVLAMRRDFSGGLYDLALDDVTLKFGEGS